MSHRGSLLILPSGMHPFEGRDASDLTRDTLAPALAEAERMDVFILGCGDLPMPVPDALRHAFSAHPLQLDAMTTSAAVRTVNVLASENRRFGAVLLAVDGPERRR
ncbi:MAG: hypothetical protein KDI98_01885 [Hyphomicrobiaceae bacterium]|nr:hypothetical protein [Hyphomicrobiaceae bacterium]